MKPKRVSNKVKQRQLQTKYLQEQTKKMQQKLGQLKKQIQQQRSLKATTNFQTTVTRWQKVTRTQAPLKNYAKQVLEQQKQAYKKFGINQKKITGTKTFSNIKKMLKQEKQFQQQNNLTKIPSLMSKKSMNKTSSNKQVAPQSNEIPQKMIQNNFMKAKMDIKNLIRQKTILQFLQEIFLQQYYNIFKQNNITQLSDLRFLTKQQLQDMGIAKGHQIKIMKKIKEEFQKSKSPMKNVFPKNQEIIQQKQQIKQQKLLVQMGYGQGNINDYAEIQQNQKKQILKQQFQQNFEQAQSDNVSQEQQNDVVLITVPLSQIALQTGQNQNQYQDQMSKSMAQNCFNCYKIIPLKNQPLRSPDNRNFCSSNCLKIYKLQMQKTCPQCRKQFFKSQGYYQQGLWFCSLGCCPNKDQIQQMFLQWTQNQKVNKFN